MPKELDVKNTILESKRLILRGWQKEDLDDLYQIFTDPAISEIVWMSHQYPPWKKHRR